MTCPRCQGTERKCAFNETNAFTSDNWNCGTMNALRDLAVFSYRDDNSAGAIAVCPIPDSDSDDRGYVVMNFYKNRCRTNSAWVMNENDPPKPLTLDVALWIIRCAKENEGVIT